ncbi:4-amino-4-deoxy-L-arabinose transferase-like glycosyltransferase [Catalinimonas alkaloidigena]|uniref:ArnT family glycosyltransferase n=1 Tax=Catalinimonas alkaloidigena TaxID=1075417 RepID=UPI0024051F2F|nr:glycosyltransferase family 39 protein [Catalinimonas alkaloidigena]MDF9795707.1 4-amino-4-deoxy-L-arabinose transferase-like glycosyltransferase [Catalinimonas alkaloidigena]
MSRKPLSTHNKQALPNLSRNEAYLAASIFVLLLFALFFQLGVHPLKHEEPRRALVALEMIFRGNWIVPTEVGALYYNKPPIYNWLIILSFKLFGSYAEFAVRFFSVLSFLGMGGLIFIFGRKYVSLSFGIYTALFFLVSVDILYYFSLTGEIDLFYSLVTLASLLAVYHFYHQQRFWSLFLWVYLLTAIGTLTKGLPSIAFTGITLLTWFIYRRDFRKLFLPAHFAGIFLFLLLVGSYFWAYSLYNDPTGFIERLFSESSSRTAVDEGNGFLKLVAHIFEFPLTTFVNIMPSSLLLAFMFRRGFINQLKRQPVITFITLIFIANFLLYWLSPGARARYTYMLYPFPIMMLVYYFLLPGDEAKAVKVKLLHRIILVLIVIVAASGMAIPFVPVLQANVPGLWWVALLTSSGALAILGLYIKFPTGRVLSLILLLVWFRIVFNLTVIPIRSANSSEAQDKRDADKIVSISKNAPLHVLEGSMISRTTVFYIEWQREEVLNFEEEILPDHYYMAYKDILAEQGYKYESLYNFQYKEDTLQLVKFK